MTFLDQAKCKARQLIEKVKDRTASHDTREADVTSDPTVANSREGKDGEVGTYVGRTFPDTLSMSERAARRRAAKRKGSAYGVDKPPDRISESKPSDPIQCYCGASADAEKAIRGSVRPTRTRP